MILAGVSEWKKKRGLVPDLGRQHDDIFVTGVEWGRNLSVWLRWCTLRWRGGGGKSWKSLLLPLPNRTAHTKPRSLEWKTYRANTWANSARQMLAQTFKRVLPSSSSSSFDWLRRKQRKKKSAFVRFEETSQTRVAYKARWVVARWFPIWSCKASKFDFYLTGSFRLRLRLQLLNICLLWLQILQICRFHWVWLQLRSSVPNYTNPYISCLQFIKIRYKFELKKTLLKKTLKIHQNQFEVRI